MYYPPGQMVPHFAPLPLQQSLPLMNQTSQLVPQSLYSKYSTKSSYERLSSLSVEGVSKMISTFDGICKQSLPAYQETMLKHNINGRVLLVCDLNELKVVLGKMEY